MGINTIDSQWIGQANRDVRIIDTRRSRDYDEGHIYGAVSLPVTEFVKSIGRLKDAPDAEAFAVMMSRLGIRNDTPVVAYDDQHGVYAARLLWTLDLYGHEYLYLLDKNFSAYVMEGNKITKEVPRIEQGNFRVKGHRRQTAILDDVLVMLRDGGGLLLDAGERMDFLNGHIPGALNLPWRMLVDREHNFLREERLKRIFLEHGIEEATDVVAYCKDGMTSAHLYVALRLSGHEKVRLYSRGYAEWEAAKLPVKAEFQELLNP